MQTVSGSRPVRVIASAFLRNLGTIFMCHRFSDREAGTSGHSPETLRGALARLRRERARIVSLEALVKAGLAGESVRGMVAFTVDDGYDDFYRVAAPVFQEFDCPVTVFLPSGFLDGRGWLWWDRVRLVFRSTDRTTARLALQQGEVGLALSGEGEKTRSRRELCGLLARMPTAERDAALQELEEVLEVSTPPSPPAEYSPLSWDQVRELGKGGVSFGPHTSSHANLATLEREEAEGEIADSWRRLRQETDAATPVFCYPFGEPWSVRSDLQESFQELGFLAAVTAGPCHVSGAAILDDPFALPRIGWPDDVAAVLRITSGVTRIRQVLTGSP